jgi:hypothetical protein
MKEITIYDKIEEGTGAKRSLIAKITNDGDLSMEGYDVGEKTKELTGDSDYEYWITVKSDVLPDVILNLIKENFVSSSEFMKWLEKKGIKYDFYSFT